MNRRTKRDTGEVWSQCGMPLLLKIIDATPAGVFLCDRDGTILAVNPAFTKLTGYNAEAAVGMTPRILKSGRHDASFYRRFWTRLAKDGAWQGQLWNRKKSGAIAPHWMQVSALRDDAGAVAHYVALMTDMSKLKLPDERTIHLAYHDPLTGLPNRLLFADRLKRTLLRAQRAERMVAVVYIDLDDFKPVNDELGHAAGDALLRAVAERLQTSVRSTDTAARFGGDEFALVLDGFADDREVEARVTAVFTALTQPLSLRGKVVPVRASVGVALFPRDGADGEALLGAADGAMYRAKARGKGRLELVPG